MPDDPPSEEPKHSIRQAPATARPQRRGKQDDSPSSDDVASRHSSGWTGLWAELKRRHVVRVATVYLIVGWLVIQVANATFGEFGIPAWAYRFVVLMVALGFPISVILAWAFELTPEGIKTTKHAKEQKAEESATSTAFKRKRQWFTILFAAGLPTLIFGALAVYFYATRAVVLESTDFDKSIAVLPFTNMSPDAENAYFADGIHETILTTLANLGDLRVTSRTTVMPYRGSDKPIPLIGEELNVAYILEGSVQRVENQFRLTTQLIRTRTDEHLWATNYDGEFKDVLNVQTQLSREISESLHAVLTPEEEQRLDKKPTDNLFAYELYLKALSLGYRRTTEAIELLDQATKLDPRFTLAWVRLSSQHSFHYQQFLDRTEGARKRAREAINRAIELEPENPEVVMELGHFFYVFDRDYVLADYLYRQAQRKIPQKAQLHMYIGASLKRQEGKSREALEAIKKGYELEPTFGKSHELVTAYMRANDWAQAREQLLESIRFSENPSHKKLTELWAGLFNGAVEVELEGLDPYHNTLYSWAIGNANTVVEHTSEKDKEDDNVPGSLWGLMLHRSPSWRYSIANLVAGDEAEGRQSLLHAIDRLELKVSRNRDDYSALRMLGLSQAALGDQESFLDTFNLMAELLSSKPDFPQEVQVSIDRAIALAWLGQKDESVRKLGRLIKMPSRLNVHFMRHCLDFWPLRDHPGFQAILEDPANHQSLDLDKL